MVAKRKAGRSAGNSGSAGSTENAGNTGSTGETGDAGRSTGNTGEGERVEDVTRVTPAQLEAEASAAMAGAPPETPAAPAMPAPTGPSQADIEAGYAALAGAVLDGACGMVCPAWRVTDQEKGKLAGALGHALNLWFPDEIPEKWIALIVVAGVGVEIIGARRDPRTGKLAPRYFPPPPEKTAAAPAAAPAVVRDPHAPVQ